MIIDQQTWITHNYYIPWRHNWQRRRKIRERRETWRKRGAIPWSVPVSVIVCRWTMKKCRMSDYRAFFIRSSLRLHLSRRFTFVLCLAFHHPQSPAFQRLEDRASSNRLSIRLPRRKPNDNASVESSRPRCDFQGDFFAFNTPGDVCLSAIARSRAKGQIRIYYESMILSFVKDPWSMLHLLSYITYMIFYRYDYRYKWFMVMVYNWNIFLEIFFTALCRICKIRKGRWSRCIVSQGLLIYD